MANKDGWKMSSDAPGPK